MFNNWATPRPGADDVGQDRDLEWERALADKIADAFCSARTPTQFANRDSFAKRLPLKLKLNTSRPALATARNFRRAD
jgi:hypothetical protein